MKIYSWLLAALCALALIWVLYGQNAPLEQIGLIDMGKILSESEYAQRLNEQLAEKYDQLIAQLQSSDTEGIDEETRADQSERFMPSTCGLDRSWKRNSRQP